MMPETEAATADSAALSIVQSRDANLAEGKEMTAIAWRCLAAICHRDPLYWLFQLVALGAVIYATISLIALLEQSAEANPSLMWSVAFLPAAAAALSATHARVRNVAARGN